ncbi:MAG TPA: zinc ABC transporter substrate-binding protein, partial [Terriglobales bacterium]|nr:zinc ABC transporter substrate-binding protein [Terriglobales bacterium]
MAALRRFIAMWLYQLFAALCLAGCVSLGQAAPAWAQDRIRVVATTTDLRSLTEAVGGDLVDAVSLVPANFDAEEYQPKPQDVLRLKDARLVVRVGL